MARTNWFLILLKTILTKAFRLTIETVCELLWNGFSELHSEHFAQVLFYHKMIRGLICLECVWKS